MEFHLKQWRSQKQHESEQQASAKIPRLLLDSPHPRHNPSVASESQSEPEDSALQLFVSPPHSNSKISTHLTSSPHQHSTPLVTAPTPIFPRTTGGYFSLAQWQELELQALIFRHMLAGVAVPPELLQPIIKKSLLDSYPHYLHPSLLQHPELVQSGYWGKVALDPEPGRCRRTDGKKWRCSRDVVAGHKYCERHVHRGRNRSRKHVEVPTAAAAGRAASVMAVTPEAVAASGMPFALSERLPSSTEILHPHSRPSESVAEKGLFGGRREMTRSDAQMLRPFFDDWPRSLPEESDCITPATSSAAAATSLSISIRPSDTSLTLSTGNDGGEMTPQPRQGAPSWGPGWGSNQVSSMGGPLAEALRSSVTSSSSPTSVLHRTPRCSAPRTSYVT